VCLSWILVRVGLDFVIDDSLYHTLSIAVAPFIMESVVNALIARSFFGMPYGLCFALGFLLAGIGPGSLFGALASIRAGGHGALKKIPVKIMSASGLENTICFIAFGISSSVAIGEF
jgi:hypothetical protein